MLFMVIERFKGRAPFSSWNPQVVRDYVPTVDFEASRGVAHSGAANAEEDVCEQRWVRVMITQCALRTDLHQDG